MKKAYYFSHDRNARNDEKIMKLRSEYGWEGYGLYFALLEILFETEKQKISFDNIKFLSYNLNVKQKKLEQFINYCCTVELLKKDENYFWSNGLKKRCEEINKKIEQTREAGRISAQKRKEKKQQMLENRCNENSTSVEKNVNENLTIKLNKINNSIKDNIDNNSNISIKASKKEIKKEKEERKTFDDLIDSYTQNEDLREELKNHLAVRKQKKASLTNRAIELSLKSLDNLTVNVFEKDKDKTKIQIVQQSILNGWIGFFELKEQNNKTKSDLNYNKSTFANLESLYDNDSS